MFRSILKENNPNPETGITAPAFLCALFLFLVYLYYLAPDIVSGDSAELVCQSYLLGVCHTTGYPSTVVAGKIFSFLPYGNIAFRVNLLSAVCAASTVFFTILTLHVLLKNRSVAVFGGIVLGLSPVLWSRAESANVHVFAGALIALYIFLLVLFLEKGNHLHFLAAMFVFGLSWTAHMQNLLHVAAVLWIILVRRKELSWRIVACGAGFFILGLTPYIWMMARAAVAPPFAQYNSPTTPSRLISYIFGVSAKPWRLNFELLSGGIVRVLKLYAGSFLLLGIPLAIVGLVSLWKRNRNAVLFFGMIQVSNVFYFASFDDFYVSSRIIPSFIAMAVWIAAGMNWIRLWMKSKSATVARQAAYAALVVWTVAAVLIFPSPALMEWSARVLRCNFPAVDWRNVREGREFIHAMENGLPADAVILTPWTYFALLKYAQEVEGFRPDVHLLLHSGTAAARRRLSIEPNSAEALDSLRPLLFVDGRGISYIREN